MKKYKILEHPADLEIKVWGVTKEELFANAMGALSDSLRPEIKDFPAEDKIRVSSEDLESLLVDFLNEVNYLSEVKGETYTKIFFEKFEDTEIVAEIYGNKVTRFGLQIKAATFHDLKIEKEKGRWEAKILFDI